MPLEPITGHGHYHEGLRKFCPPFWGKPRIASLLLAMINRVQELEDSCWDVLERYTLEGADTARLNVLGKIVGQPRFTSNDELYRAVLRAKIRANLSRGLTDDIIEVVQLITNETAVVYVQHYTPATAFVWTLAEGAYAVRDAFRILMPKTRAAGVQLHMFFTPDPEDAAIWDESTWDDGSVYWEEEIL